MFNHQLDWRGEFEVRVRQLEAVAAIGQKALLGSDLMALMHEATETVARLLGNDFAEVLQLEAGGDRLLLAAGVGWPPGQVGRATVRAGPYSQAGYTLLSGKPVIVEDLSTETRFTGSELLREHGGISGISAAIYAQGKAWGVLGTHSRRPRSFTVHDIHFLQAVANVLSAAIERKRQEEHRALLEAVIDADDAIITLTLEGVVTSWNPAAERVYGYAAQEMVGRPIVGIFVSDGFHEISNTLARVRQGEHVESYPAQRIRKDGTQIDVLVSTSPVRDGSGHIIGATSIVRDVRRERRAKDQQQFLLAMSLLLTETLDLESTLRSLAGLAVPVIADLCAIHLVIPGGVRTVTVIHADSKKQQAAENLARANPVDLSQESGVARVLRTGVPELYPVISEQFLAETSRNAEHRALLEKAGLRSGLVVPLKAGAKILGTVTLAMSESGRYLDTEDLRFAQEFAHCVALAIDNARLYGETWAAKQQSEEALALLDTLLMSAPVGLCFFDTQLRFVRANHALATMNRCPIASLLGRPLAEVLPELSVKVEPWLRQVLTFGEPIIGVEISNDDPDQRRQYLLASYYPVKGSDGQILGVGGVLLDITQRKSFERMKDELLSLAAHELKTPLTSIKGFSQLLLHKSAKGTSRLSDTDIYMLETIDDRIGYIVGLVEQLLDFSRIETNRLDLEVQEVDVVALIEHVLVRERQLHPEHRLTLSGGDAPIVGMWDAGRLEQVFTNLLNNAVKYSDRESTVAVQLHAEAGTFEATIHDQGIGVPVDDLPHLFERHYRASNAGGPRSGLGLGLHLSKSIVERHGGRIWAESEEGVGSTFHVALPLSANPPAADTTIV